MFKKRIVKTETRKRKAEEEVEQESSQPQVLSEPVISSIKPNETKKRLLKESSTTSKQSNVAKPSREVEYHTSKSLTKPENKAVVDTEEVDQKSVTGPLKPVPVNIRTTTITDFQPEVCKDFQQTGYCGYGDTCKFLHIRDESKNKKPVVKEWENITKTTSAESPNNVSEDKTSQSIPFKCVLCKQDYKFPIKTICNHYFCKQCFLDRVKKNHKNTCFICNKDTNGICYPVSGSKLRQLLDN